MLLRSFNRATQFPELHVSDILNESIFHPEERLAATEMLGFVHDVSISMPAFEKQLAFDDSLMIECVLLALRTLYMRDDGAILSRAIRERLVEIATSSKSPSIRINAANGLADFRFT